MPAEFLKKGWNVVGTVRGGVTRTELHDLADEYRERVDIQVLDINEPAQIASLRERLWSGRSRTVSRTLGRTRVNVLLAKRDRPGLEYLDYLGRTVPW
jgi:NAD(P)-dependent dehydrogenase (short-subunit alcohol dehydrogenase family)